MIPLVLLAFLSISIFPGCKDALPFDWQPAVETPGTVAAENDFGLSMLQTLSVADADQNIFISPASISMALGMTWNGANGLTDDAFAATLQAGQLDRDAYNKGNQDLIRSLPLLDPAVELSIANSIWYDKAFSVKQPFLDVNQTYYSGEVRQLDFKDAGSPAVINSWVDDKTNGRIDKVLESISAEEVMFLINAIYFKGNWKYEFKESKTSDRPFHLPDGSMRNHPLMEQEGTFPYRQTAQYQAVELPYGDSAWSMVVVLPDSGNDLGDLVAGMDAAAWKDLTDGLTASNVRVRLPKIKLEYKKTLNSPLSDLGLGIAFTDDADFSGIADASLLISRVLHKTFLEVNEKGTEAAAVTVVGVAVTSIGSEPVFIDMTVDRPFLLAIRENSTGLLLFLGAIYDPPV
jgi:serpin B